MADNQSLLNNERQESPRRPFRSNSPATVPTMLKPRRETMQMIIFNITSLAFMAIHLTIFTWQNGKPVHEIIPQNLSTALANILAILAEISLLGGLRIAYEQILRTVCQKTPVFGLEDILRTLNSSPWNLVRPKVLVWILKVKELWLVSLLCTGIPFAAVFPPGALTVEFENAVPTTLSNVPTMNISDYGNGTHQSFREKSLLEMNVDFTFLGNLRPSLNALASQVLSLGEHVRLSSPCGSSCEYDISLEGPRFRCRHVGPEEAVINECPAIYTAKDDITYIRESRYKRMNNSVKISWHSEICESKSVKTIDCTTTLATYNLHINNSRDASQSVIVKLENEREFWNNTAYIQTGFYDYFYKGDGLTPANDTLRANFTNAQAFAISRGAVHALQGVANTEQDGFGEAVEGNASQVLSSPYIGRDRFSTDLEIPPEKIERYLQDVVVSAISLGISTHNGGVKAVIGAEIYKFDEKVQFFVGYGSSLVVSVCICIFSCFCMAQNVRPRGPTLTRAVPLQRFEALE